MKWGLLLTLALVAVPLAASAGEPLPSLGERVFVLTMSGTSFNEQGERGPLLEAYLGEALSFYVHVPLYAEAHTFHLHGHPWWDSSTNRFIDTKLLHPGDLHEFTVLAGGEGHRTGDWLYHCHFDGHFEEGMWGILRVYPFATTVTPAADGYRVQLDRLGEPVEGAHLSLALDGEPVEAQVREMGHGSYRILSDAVPVDDQELVVTADHDLGQSVARLQATVDGLEPLRDVGPPPLALGAGPADGPPNTPGAGASEPLPRPLPIRSEV